MPALVSVLFIPETSGVGPGGVWEGHRHTVWPRGRAGGRWLCSLGPLFSELILVKGIPLLGPSVKCKENTGLDSVRPKGSRPKSPHSHLLVSHLPHTDPVLPCCSEDFITLHRRASVLLMMHIHSKPIAFYLYGTAISASALRLTNRALFLTAGALGWEWSASIFCEF